MAKLRLKAKERSYAWKLLIATFLIWLAFLAFSILKASTSQVSYSASNVVTVTDPNMVYSLIRESGVTILYFSQELCPGCAKVEPALLRYASENPSIRVVKINLDRMLEKNPRATLELLGNFKVLGTPTIIVYLDGREVGRHVSTFGFGDQYEPLKEFVKASIEGKEFSEGSGLYTQVGLEGSRAFDPSYIVVSSLTALSLGLIAAFSPCSLPMIAAYSLYTKGSGVRLSVIVRKALTLASVTLIGGSGLVILYVTSYMTPINVYKLLISLMASLLIAWGMLTVLERKYTLIEIPGLTKVLPLLGLQCSLPFLIATLSTLEAAPHIMFLGSIAFTLGYITPYIAATTSVDLVKNMESLMRTRVLLVAQGLILVGAGLYVLYNVKSLI